MTSQYKKVVFSAIVFTFFINPVVLNAQGLEEIVVTAQRRSQSLQDVPISIDVVSGQTIDKQGFSFLRDLADFTPGLLIKNRFEEQGMTVRGSGTTGKNLSTEQAAPIFVDGIYFGMANQTMNAFLDAERVEVLKGPQPVFFGQSATAGAIGITSRKPGDVWEGRAVMEYARNSTHRLELAIGGPITDTLGIRVAAKLKRTDGYMEDIFTGNKFPFEQEKGARVILQWKPTDNFDAIYKIEVADQDLGTRSASLLCGVRPIGNNFGMSLLVYGVEGIDFEPLDCKKANGKFTRRGFGDSDIHIAPPPYITANTNPRNTRGVLNLTGLEPGDLGPDDDPFYRGMDLTKWLDGDFSEEYKSAPWNSMLNLTYRMDNGLELSSLTGFTRQVYSTQSNTTGPLNTEAHRKYIDYNSWSQEFRVSSSTGGTFEWMIGAYYQLTEVDILGLNWRAEPGTAFRSSANGEDDEYKNLFATVTYNFMENKASLDVGARLSNVQKTAFSDVFQAEFLIEDPVTGDTIVAPRNRNTVADGLNGALVVGRTPFYRVRFNEGEIDDTKVNPQVVFRYRPSDNVSLYAKWATGFKAGAFEQGQPQPPGPPAYQFGPENVKTYEVGARRTFLDGRANANLTLFWTNYRGLQVTSRQEINGVVSGRTANAAKQRGRGAELAGRVLVGDRTSVGYSVMLLDSKMLDFTTATCNTPEVDQNLCTDPVARTIDRSGEESIMAPEWQASFSVDHWVPVFTNYKLTFNANTILSDDYITDRNWDRRTTMHDSADLNLTMGYGDVDDVWQVSLWARNIMARKVTYNPQFHLSGDGLLQQPLNSNNFMSYGLQLKYDYK
ncbi:MAG: iron complex outermembrane receptor protein [Gammaproteobacteria bacterium]|jgi:iron complex outermembrane receptor protein